MMIIFSKRSLNCLHLSGLILLHTISLGQTITALKQSVSSLDSHPDMNPANWGFCVIDPTTQEVIINHHASKRFVTASTMKAVTTATALLTLGAEFQYRTSIEFSGMVSPDSTLYGDIFIRGSGDPTIGSNRFGTEYQLPSIMSNWVKNIQQSGISRIQGRIIADASAFSTQVIPGKWTWEDIGNYYGAGAGGINIFENQYRLDLKPGNRVGAMTKVLRTVPMIPGLSFHNEVTTGPPGSGDNAYIYGGPYTYDRYLRGTIPAGVNTFSIKGSIPDPTLQIAIEFTDALQAKGIEVANAPTTIRREKLNPNSNNAQQPQSYTFLFSHLSPPLKEIIVPTNHQSVNLFAEALLKQLAVNDGKKGNTEMGLDALAEFWNTQGLNLTNNRLRDGSGLSPNNAISPYQLTQILAFTYNTPQGELFLQSLPIAGREGTMRSVGQGTLVEGRIFAKSGYISGVRAYAGYAQTLGGRTLAFTMISNYFNGSPASMRDKFTRLMIKLVQLRQYP